MSLSSEQDMIFRELSRIENQHGDKVAAQKYAALQDRLRCLEEESKRPMVAVDPSHPADMAMRKVGMAVPRDVMINDRGFTEPERIFNETRKWHLAAAKVFEYMEAQIHMDLFKGDVEATTIFRQILIKGFTALHHEADPRRF